MLCLIIILIIICPIGIYGSDNHHDGYIGIASLSQINDDGKYYLIDNIELNGAFLVDKEITICLNGFSIYSSYGFENVLIVTNLGSLTIEDCTSQGKIYHSVAAHHYAIRNNGNLILNGGNIVDNYGGIDNQENFIMNGGSVLNSSNYAIYNQGNLEINGGTIKDNNDYGICINSFNSINNIRNCLIINNLGGICLYNGTLNISGGLIENNTTKGGLFTYGGTINMSGGTIINNTNIDRYQGGGVHIASEANINISNEVHIENNTCSNLYLSSGKQLNIDNLSNNSRIGITGDINMPIILKTSNINCFYSDNIEYELSVNKEDNSLSLIKNSSIILQGDDIYYLIDIKDCNIEGDILIKDNKTYGKLESKITIIPHMIVGTILDFYTSNVNIIDNSFIMPAKKVSIKANYINYPTYVIDIPESIELNETLNINVTNVNIKDGYNLQVSLNEDNKLTLRNNETKLWLKLFIKDNEIKPGDSLLTVSGGILNNNGSCDINFESQRPIYAGIYKGLLIFDIVIKEDIDN